MRLTDADELRKRAYPFPCATGVEYAVTLRDIGDAPTIDPESLRPVGHWVYDPNGIDWGIGAWRCSECHTRNHNLPADTHLSPYLFEGSSYCPGCGVRMEAPTDD